MEKILKIPEGKSLDEFLTSLNGARIESLISGDEGMEKRDALFRSMRNKQVAKAVVKGLVTGLVVGGTAQELGAFLHEGQEGLVKGLIEGHKEFAKGTMGMTSLEYLRRYFTGDLPRAGNGVMHEVMAGSAHMKLPEGVDLASSPDGSFNLIRDGHVLSQHITLDGSGHLTAASQHALAEQGVIATSSMETIQGVHTAGVAPDDYIRTHGGEFTKVHRGLWYANDTPAPVFDKNELRADLLIDHHSGAYEFSTARMMPDGSYETVGGVKLSADAHALAATGHLKMLLSLSRGTQNQVVEVPIGADFKAHIDPNSEIGNMFFQTVNGKPVFIGKFAEVAQVTGTNHGVEQVRLLATDVGKGIASVPGNVPVAEHVPVNTFDVPADYRVDPPPFIPIFGRRPLEPTESAKRNPDIVNYAYNGFTHLKREDYEYRMSAALKENPDADIDEKKEIKDYLQRQEADYLQNIERLAATTGPMGFDCKLSVCIPVAAHQEGKVIYHTLENYLNQTAKNNEFELVLFANHPDKDKNGNAVIPDETMSEISRFIKITQRSGWW